MKRIKHISIVLLTAIVLLISLPGFTEDLKGETKKIFTISPEKIVLSGAAGTPARAFVQIIPEKKYSFNIKKVYADSGREIKFRLKSVHDPERKKRHVLFVENVKDTPGHYTDTIHIITDSDVQPEISVMVYGDILGPSNENSPKVQASYDKPLDFFPSNSDQTNKTVIEEKVSVITIRFESGSSVISPDNNELRQIAYALKSGGLKNARILIQGHTDSSGSSESNLLLSLSRAKRVKDILVNTYGIEKDRLSTEGLGETMPITSNATPSGRAINRRIEFVYLGD